MPVRAPRWGNQSLAQLCGDFYIKMVLTDVPLTETTASPYARLGSSLAGIEGALDGCGSGTAPQPIAYQFADTYHHHDHPGSLRVEADQAGNRVTDAITGVRREELIIHHQAPSRRRCGSSRERSAASTRDLTMPAAAIIARAGRRFLSPDEVVGNTQDPQTWNRYSYVMNNPMMYTDPASGKLAIRPENTGTYGAGSRAG
ncbi:MAG: hypothetical protein U0V87_00825 [Acidobacteriota bacterium]